MIDCHPPFVFELNLGNNYFILRMESNCMESDVATTGGGSLYDAFELKSQSLAALFAGHHTIPAIGAFGFRPMIQRFGV